MTDSRKIEEELVKILRQAYGGNYTLNYAKVFDNRFGPLQDELGRFIKEVKQAYDLAMLSQNMLTGANLTNFIQRSVELASK